MITPIIKVDSSCNLGCYYCYYLGPRGNGRRARMDYLTLDSVIKNIIEVNKETSAHFVWHGGEPLQVGIDFYKKALELQSEYRRENQDIRNSIQTNGTLLTPQW